MIGLTPSIITQPGVSGTLAEYENGVSHLQGILAAIAIPSPLLMMGWSGQNSPGI